jgi:hypothetical protein
VRLRYTPRALAELDEVLTHIAERSPRGARRLRLAVFPPLSRLDYGAVQAGMERESEISAEVKEIDQRLDAVTDLMSNRVRTIAGGVAAFGWSIMVGLPDMSPISINRRLLFMPVALSLASLMADLLQYFVIWMEYIYQRSRIGKGYRSGSWRGLHMTASLLFTAKIILVAVSACWLVTVLGLSLMVE